MRFSREYTKLQDHVFTTIRFHSFYNEGQIIDCKTPLQIFEARVLVKFSVPFIEIPEGLLRYDTDSPELSGAQIRDEIRTLYGAAAPKDHDDMTIYLLEKLK